MTNQKDKLSIDLESAIYVIKNMRRDLDLWLDLYTAKLEQMQEDYKKILISLDAKSAPKSPEQDHESNG